MPRFLPIALVAGALLACGSGSQVPPAADAKADSGPKILHCPLDARFQTRPCFENAGQFSEMAAHFSGQFAAVKFVLANFSAGGPSSYSSFNDPGFYAMHDEWYWFRLLNGVAIPGLSQPAVSGPPYPSVAAIYAQFAGQKTLPLDLKWYGSRLYSEKFYDLALPACMGTGPACQRFFGVGTLFHLPADPKRPRPEELWLFQLEYTDRPTLQELAVFFGRLQAMLPDELAGKLRFVAQGSPWQQKMVADLRAGSSWLKDRALTWAELVAPGDVQGYTPGLTAGRLRKLTVEELANAQLQPTDIVLLDAVPTEIGLCAGIVTASPQTPQAHLNLLAAARGTPNAFVANAYADKILDLWAKDRRPVALEVTATTVRWKLLTGDQWQTWQGMQKPQPQTVEMPSVAQMAVTMPLTGASVAEGKKQLPKIGGKAAGFMALTSEPTIVTPPKPMALTVRGYAEFMQDVTPVVAELMQAEGWSDARFREVLLEGPVLYAAKHASDAEAMKVHAWLTGNQQTGAVATVLNAGGLQALLLGREAPPPWKKAALKDLQQNFADLAPDQALRFRSSSTAEDIEGFNGAGVYISVSGYLDAAGQPDPKNQQKTWDWAVRQVWASFWSADAYEEREAAGIAHLSARMGIVVHPRFDDKAENANGVVLFTLKRMGDGQFAGQLSVDVQPGSLSVTNPPPGNQDQPEIDVLAAQTGTQPAVLRVQAATAAKGKPVLSDAELQAMFGQAMALAQKWLDSRRAGVAAGVQPSTVVLDFEFRRVDGGWPKLAAGRAPLPPRLVWKQVRPLEHVGPVRAEQLAGVSVPSDILHAAVDAELATCKAGEFTATATLLYTDAAGPTLGGKLLLDYAKAPFVAGVQLTLAQAVGSLAAGTVLQLPHTDGALQVDQAGAWTVAGQGGPLQKLAIAANGDWTLSAGGGSLSGKAAKCRRDPLATSKAAWLQGVLDGE